MRRTKAQMALVKAAAGVVPPPGYVADGDYYKPEPMNALALRIWNGQGASEPEAWRVKRVIEGLKSQGYEDMRGLVLPVEVGKYL